MALYNTRPTNHVLSMPTKRRGASKHRHSRRRHSSRRRVRGAGPTASIIRLLSRKSATNGVGKLDPSTIKPSQYKTGVIIGDYYGDVEITPAGKIHYVNGAIFDSPNTIEAGIPRGKWHKPTIFNDNNQMVGLISVFHDQDCTVPFLIENGKPYQYYAGK